MQNKRVLILAFVLATVVIGTIARMWWRAHYYVETNNAHITGHIHPISSRIEGVVTQVLIQDNQTVSEGDVIAELDATAQTIKIEQIQAQLEAAVHQLQQADAQIAHAYAQAGSAKAQVSQAQAQSLRAEKEAQRYVKLYKSEVQAVSKSDLEATNATSAAANADVMARQHGKHAANAQVRSAESARDIIKAQQNLLLAQLKEAQQQLNYHRITSPVAGRIGKRSVEVGTRVKPGQALAAIVENTIWVTANFKETQINKLQRGQFAKVSIDALPGVKLTGKIESFSPASGSEFSLLPADNATGNFTKIVQRIPVKVILLPLEIKKHDAKIVPGMSATVEVDLATS